MREFDKPIVITLPKNGLAAHGTNLARARAIEAQGTNNLWHVSLTSQGPFVFSNELRNQTRHALYECWERAVFKTRNLDYLVGNNEADNFIPALVFLQPLDEPPSKTQYSRKHETDQMPASNILGVLSIPNLSFDIWHKSITDRNTWRMAQDSLLSSTYRFLRRKGTISSARHQQLQQD